MNMKVTSLLAAAFLAAGCALAAAQGAGAGGGASGAGSDISVPRANPGPGGTAKQNAGMTTRKVHKKSKKKKHRMM